MLRAAVVALLLLGPRDAHSQPVSCPTDAQKITDALSAMRRVVDPCGESSQVLEVLRRLERCPKTGYQICVSTEVSRNVFDRPLRDAGELPRATITWNPELRSELEETCDGNPAMDVRRDPTASLLHELVHAVQECEGLNPGEHELETVRIENIYRRAAGLCQRSGYGEVPLPPQMVRICRAGDCPCSVPLHAPSLVHADHYRSYAANERDDRARQRNGDRPE